MFTGRSRRGGRVALEVTCHARGIRFTHSRPYHPQTCGKVERFHQTLKKWLDRQPRPATMRQLQAQLDDFRAYYNTIRPHRALGRRTPAEAYAARPKAVPTGTPIDTGHYRVRHDRIDPSGVITLRHNSRLHHIGLGRRHAGTRVLVLVHDLHIRVLTTDGELLRELHLDPTRDYQPQARTVNDVPRHLCTVSRDIAVVPPVGFEPTLPPPEGGALSPELRGPTTSTLAHHGIYDGSGVPPRSASNERMYSISLPWELSIWVARLRTSGTDACCAA